MLPDPLLRPPDGEGHEHMGSGRLTSVAVLGSCLTRDVFNRRFCPDHSSRYRVAATSYRTALPSLMSRPFEFTDDQLDGLSPADRTWMRRDATGAFLGDLASSPPDVLLVDFTVDVRFGVLDLGEDVYLTAYRWMHRRTAWWDALVPSAQPARIAPLADHQRYLALWLDALARLRSHLATVAPATDVVVVRARQARTTWLPDAPSPAPMRAHRWVPPGKRAQFDAVWDELSSRALALGGWRSIDLRGREYTSSDSHPWRAGRTHYSPEFYADLLGALDDLVADPALQAVVIPASDVPGRPWDDEPGRRPRDDAPRPPRSRARARPPVARLRRRARRLIRRTHRR